MPFRGCSIPNALNLENLHGKICDCALSLNTPALFFFLPHSHRFLLKKKWKFDALFSYETTNNQKVSLYFMKSLSFDFPENITFRVGFFTIKIHLKGVLTAPVTVTDWSKKCCKIISLAFLLDSSASKAFQF